MECDELLPPPPSVLDKVTVGVVVLLTGVRVNFRMQEEKAAAACSFCPVGVVNGRAVRSPKDKPKVMCPTVPA